MGSLVDVELGRKVIGETFEKLFKNFFGGERTHLGNNQEVGEIDITDFDKHRCVEVKGGHYRDRFILLERQYLLHKNLAEGKYSQQDLFFKDPEVYYAFFSHKVKPIRGRFNIEELEKELLDNIDSLVILSFDIMQEMYGKNEIHRPKSLWLDYMTFKRKEIRLFLDDSKKALEDFELKAEDYKIMKGNMRKNEHTNEFKVLSVITRKYNHGGFFEK